MSTRRPLLHQVGALLAVLTAAPIAHAQDAPAETFALAETKFAAGDKAGACPLYEQALAGEDRLAWKSAFLATTKLALCKRDADKLASAAALYRHAAAIIHTQATSHDNDARAAAADKAADELAATVSHVTITVAAGAAALPGFTVAFDGRALPPDQWNTPMEVDGGTYVLHASATDRVAFDQTITVADEKDAQTIAVPVLAPVVVVKPPPAPVIVQPVAPPIHVVRRRSHLPALIAAAAGAIGVGVAIGVDASARGKDATYRDDPAHPPALLDDANRTRHLANDLAIGGGVALAAGAALWFLWPAHTTSTEAPRAAILPLVGPGLAGATASVRW